MFLILAVEICQPLSPGYIHVGCITLTVLPPTFFSVSWPMALRILLFLQRSAECTSGNAGLVWTGPTVDVFAGRWLPPRIKDDLGCINFDLKVKWLNMLACAEFSGLAVRRGNLASFKKNTSKCFCVLDKHSKPQFSELMFEGTWNHNLNSLAHEEVSHNELAGRSKKQ